MFAFYWYSRLMLVCQQDFFLHIVAPFVWSTCDLEVLNVRMCHRTKDLDSPSEFCQ